MWAEPVRGSDGQLRVYLPPKAVRDFLEMPTSENARTYLAWNRARMRQVDEAVKVMREVAAQQFAIATSEPTEVGAEPSTPDADVGRVTSQLPPDSPRPTLASIHGQEPAPAETPRRISMVYAFATWCPYSRRQTPIMNELAARVPIRGVAFESRTEEVHALRPGVSFPVVQGDVELRQRLGVESYPTIFVFEGPRLRHVARGFQPADRLVAVLASLADRQPIPTAEPGGQPAVETCQPRR